ISALQSKLAAALKVKPIVTLCDGLLEISDRVRTRRRALERVLENIHEQTGKRLLNAAIVHAADPLMANDLTKDVCALLNTREVIVADLSIPVAAHLGPGAIGIVAYPIEEE
ncbi:MAG TPA: DegV family protein, partial [Anaerolineaceae bacterium]